LSTPYHKGALKVNGKCPVLTACAFPETHGGGHRGDRLLQNNNKKISALKTFCLYRKVSEKISCYLL